MKVILGLVVVLALIGYGIYASGMLTSPDPKELYDDMKAHATPGMVWTDVADFREPRKYRNVSVDNMTGMTPPSKFDRAAFTTRVNNSRFPHGFIFDYTFSEQHALHVFFAPDGRVFEVRDALTFGDLLQGNLKP